MSLIKMAFCKELGVDAPFYLGPVIPLHPHKVFKGDKYKQYTEQEKVMLWINFLSEEVLVWAAGRTSSDTHPTHLTLTHRTCHASEKPQTSSAREKRKQECLEPTPSSSFHSSQPSHVCPL